MDTFNCPNCGKILKITSNYCYNCSYDVRKISEIIKKGDIYFSLEKFPEAFDCYEKALKIDSKNSLIWIRKGNVFLRQGSEAERNKSDKKCILCPVLSEVFYEDAIKCYNKAIEINPEFKEAFYKKGLALEKLGKSIEAKKCFEMSKNNSNINYKN
ncbi:MAG: Tetratricopeptide repeat protein [Candidatus Methanofastidiosum methylothiophilum]|uniref:Tetratricopeptide repeat protein n=1 Tax=Candidatus Methanofastidiosum methylothiophilum TaxID=1705564 RepID=A0A150J1G3_9EURY|nr:MAG: Tetratricopeptide repeat protein [Candidatus Methanofastidiosum methylthiophilus]NMC77419.1 tetratricopeptide repeat protein [Candidatus Methanofastidiosa archaeon]